MNPNDQESTRYLIIDGHSVIYTWDYLHKLHKSSKTSARENLIRRLTNYQDITGERVVIVFDGRGPTTLIPLLLDRVKDALFKKSKEPLIFGEIALTIQILEYGGILNSLLTFKH